VANDRIPGLFQRGHPDHARDLLRRAPIIIQRIHNVIILCTLYLLDAHNIHGFHVPDGPLSLPPAHPRPAAADVSFCAVGIFFLDYYDNSYPVSLIAGENVRSVPDNNVDNVMRVKNCPPLLKTACHYNNIVCSYNNM